MKDTAHRLGKYSIEAAKIRWIERPASGQANSCRLEFSSCPPISERHAQDALPGFRHPKPVAGMGVFCPELLEQLAGQAPGDAALHIDLGQLIELRLRTLAQLLVFVSEIRFSVWDYELTDVCSTAAVDMTPATSQRRLRSKHRSVLESPRRPRRSNSKMVPGALPQPPFDQPPTQS